MCVWMWPVAHLAPSGLSGPSVRPGLESLLDGALAFGMCQCGPRGSPEDSGVEGGVTLPRALICTSENHVCTAHSGHSSLCRILWGKRSGPVSGPIWKEGGRTDTWASSFLCSHLWEGTALTTCSWLCLMRPAFIFKRRLCSKFPLAPSVSVIGRVGKVM